MIDRNFWISVREKWIVPAPPKENLNGGIGGGSGIDPELLKDPEEISFDDIDYFATMESFWGGGEIIMKDGNLQNPQTSGQTYEPQPTQQSQTQQQQPQMQQPQVDLKSRPKLPPEEIDLYLKEKTIPSYIEACRLLLSCNLPGKMEELYEDLADRLPVLKEAYEKYAQLCPFRLDTMLEHYIPDTIDLTIHYLELVQIDVDESVLRETEEDVLKNVDTLLLAVNDRIGEIFQYASMDIRAQAEAQKAFMGLGGHTERGLRMQ